jgi:hypothetical protein
MRYFLKSAMPGIPRFAITCHYMQFGRSCDI